MEVEKQNGIRQQKGGVQCPAMAVVGLRAGSTREQQEDAVVLAAVVPRTPRQVKRENDGQGPVPHMGYDQRQRDQQGQMNRKDPVFVEVFRAMVGAVDRRHVVRIVK